MQDGPDLVFRQAGSKRRSDAVDGNVADIHRQLQAFDLFGRLDDPCLFDRFLRIEKLDAPLGETVGTPGFASVDWRAGDCGRHTFSTEARHLLGPHAGLLLNAWTARK